LSRAAKQFARESGISRFRDIAMQHSCCDAPLTVA